VLRSKGLLAGLTVAAICATSLAACGGDGSDEDGAARSQKTVQLSIRAADGRGKVEEATLECNEQRADASGLSGRSPAELCQLARRLGSSLIKGSDPRQACTQIYGGPETARIRGTIDGRDVDRRLSRTDGCKIAEWDRVAPLLPLEAAGAQTP
jgi:hypothetical protein